MTNSSIRHLFLAVACATLMAFSAGKAVSEASGPDFYRVVDVALDDVLNMRLGPSSDHPIISELPYDANGIANLGCTGGLTLEEWTEASQEEREASRNRRWCLVGYDRTVGWVAGRFLAEDGAPDEFRAGGPLSGLAGSEWRVTWLAGKRLEDEVTVAFRSGDEVAGDAGCNRFNGRYSDDRRSLSIGPLAKTRKACPQEVMDVEARFLSALQSAESQVVRHLVLVLLDAQSVILAQFARTDWD